MSNLIQIARAHIARLPEVTAMVVTDQSGALIQSSGEVDGAAAGPVYSVAATALGQAGEQLGLGPLSRASVAGAATACLLVVDAAGVVAIQVDAKKPMGAIEKKLDGLLRR
jgi:predicted regulator of Ras-like GTPase activity (Roadblock/LC7/MglB family)